ncbi:MAG: fumarylacetoacetate hydrolase family protein [Pirellulales bacterium]|nr:fumarylacetoacetate hydrolase family protein [Pirellulales bacterium]
MRLCRFQHDGEIHDGFYAGDQVISFASANTAYHKHMGSEILLPHQETLLAYLPPDGRARSIAQQLQDWVESEDCPAHVATPVDQVKLLVPIPRPNKLLLLAGNYADHVAETGDIGREQEETFPYVFMKPPSTTLTHPGDAIRLPKISNTHIDWELELAVVIGREARGISEADALSIVAGYTIVNDISNRKFRPNPNRKERPKDKFFDWLHGKWFDGFCPCGPCVVSAEAIPDPQALELRLTVNGETQQEASASQQVFSVAQVISFASSILTLEPGDIISTGTPAGVGLGKNVFLGPGDEMQASIEGIGTLVTPVVAE